jgi:hypothetical protein
MLAGACQLGFLAHHHGDLPERGVPIRADVRPGAGRREQPGHDFGR